MVPIGRVVRLQVQAASLKVGEPRRRRYDPGPIRSVPALRLDAGGVLGLPDGGAPILDVHHRDHPASKHRGENGVSLGLTSHYAAMRARFPTDLRDGIAGENILVETDHIWSEPDLAAGVAIRTVAGDLVRLDLVTVAAPCVEFARYVLAFPDDARLDLAVTEAVRFLDRGVRGFYATFGGGSARIELDDLVYALGAGQT